MFSTAFAMLRKNMMHEQSNRNIYSAASCLMILFFTHQNFSVALERGVRTAW